MNTKNLRRAAAVLALAATAAMPVMAQDAGDLLVRARAVYLDAANKDGTGLDLSVNNKWLPEVDISYFVTPNVALELILTYPQKHDLYSGGTKIGSLKHLPPTLLAQYHFTGLGGFRPYLGAGLNLTRFSGVELPSGVSIDRTSVGLAGQVGVDVPIDDRLSFNVDLKKVLIRTDVSAGGSELGTFKVDPWLFGVGVGWKF